MTRHLLFKLFTSANTPRFYEPEFALITLDDEAIERLVTLIGAADELQKNLQCQAIAGFDHLVVHNDSEPSIPIRLLFDEEHGDVLAEAEASYVFLDEPVEDETPISPSFVGELHIFPSSFTPAIYYDGAYYEVECGVGVEELEGIQ